MNHAHSHANTVPRPALAMAIALVVVSLLTTGAVQIGLAEREAVPAVERSKAAVVPARTLSLRFADMPDGAVQVSNAASGALIATLHGENDGGGFVRGVLRGMARDRQMRGIGREPPFTLTLWQDGSLSLMDPATGRAVELGAFGPDNRKAFLRFIAPNAGRAA
jgi:putative photosynthetic complex assembly protein